MCGIRRRREDRETRDTWKATLDPKTRPVRRRAMAKDLVSWVETSLSTGVFLLLRVKAPCHGESAASTVKAPCHGESAASTVKAPCHGESAASTVKAPCHGERPETTFTGKTTSFSHSNGNPPQQKAKHFLCTSGFILCFYLRERWDHCWLPMTKPFRKLGLGIGAQYLEGFWCSYWYRHVLNESPSY